MSEVLKESISELLLAENIDGEITEIIPLTGGASAETYKFKVKQDWFVLRKGSGNTSPLAILKKDEALKRELPKNTTGVVVTEILQGSPLVFVSPNDVIVELQKKKVLNSQQFSKLIEELIEKDEKTLYLAIFNSSNQRSYITVKLK